MKQPQWQERKAKLQEATDELATKTAAGEAELAAMQFLLQQKAKERKAAANSERYLRMRIANKLINGHHGRCHAKVYSYMVESAVAAKVFPESVIQNPTDEQFNVQTVAVWFGESPSAKAKLDVFTKIGSIVRAKQESVAQYIHDNDSGGCMAKLDIEPAAVSHLINCASPYEPDHRAHCPWLVACKPWHFRFGAAVWPSPGQGCWVHASAELASATLLLTLIPVEPILRSGISLEDLPAHLESPSGNEFFRKSATVMKVSAQAVVWIPYGQIALPLVIDRMPGEGSDASGSSGAQAAAEVPSDKMFGVFTVLQVASIVGACSLHKPTWTAISGLNSSTFQKNAARSSWISRIALASMFDQEVHNNYKNGT